MNERLPYEQHLAEKLQQLPPPLEPDKAWEQMKVLLDNELPRGNGSGGNGRWWLFGMIAGILIIGTWFFTQQLNTGPRQATAAKNNTAIEKETNSSPADNQQPDVDRLPSAQHPPGSGSSGNIASPADADHSGSGLSANDLATAVHPNNVPAAATKDPSRKINSTKVNADAANTDQSFTSAKKGSPADHQSSGDQQKTDKNIFSHPENRLSGKITDHQKTPAYTDRSTQQSELNKDKSQPADNTVDAAKNSIPNVPVQPNSSEAGHQKNNLNDLSNPAVKTTAAITGKNTKDREIIKEPGKSSNYNSTEPGRNNAVTNNKTIVQKNGHPNQDHAPSDLAGSVPDDIENAHLAIQTNQLVPGQLINNQYASSHSLFRYFPRKKADPKKINRRADNMERSFAIGLSLPLGFPLADQQALGYNYRGGVNTVSDYLPSPHLQYHVNKRTYLQTEIQVIAPQYIRPVLLYQEKYPITTNTWMYNSVYAKKLYYFNLPVSVYHSPLPNFFLGTGLQFSSLVSGVAMYENKKIYGNQEMILSQQYHRINQDSLTSRVSNSEIRLLLDVNYYWERFTVGLRYNQAFGNYIGFRLNNTTGYTYDKNKALLFYLRYNIWEDRKRKQPAKSMLSLK